MALQIVGIDPVCCGSAAMAEARVHAGRTGGGSVEASHALSAVADEVSSLLDTVSIPPLRFAALNALLWAQVFSRNRLETHRGF